MKQMNVKIDNELESLLLKVLNSYSRREVPSKSFLVRQALLMGLLALSMKDMIKE